MRKIETAYNKEKLENNQQSLLVYTDRHKGNKISVRIEGFIGNENDLKNLKICCAKQIQREIDKSMLCVTTDSFFFFTEIF